MCWVGPPAEQLSQDKKAVSFQFSVCDSGYMCDVITSTDDPILCQETQSMGPKFSEVAGWGQNSTAMGMELQSGVDIDPGDLYGSWELEQSTIGSQVMDVQGRFIIFSRL